MEALGEKIGYVTGVFIGITIMLGIVGVFVLSLIKSIKTRRKGWIIAAVLTGLPCMLYLVVLAMGVIRGIHAAANNASQAQRQNQPDFLAAPMEPVTGSIMPYEVSLPSKNLWRDQPSGVFDHVFVYKDYYLATIAERVGVGSNANMCKMAQDHLLSVDPNAVINEPAEATLGNHTWLTYDAAATVQNMKIKYRFYVYSDSEQSFQIIGWTGPDVFEEFAPIMQRFAVSFTFPEKSANVNQKQQQEQANFLEARMDSITGSIMDYEVSLPSRNLWRDQPSGAFDHLFVHKEYYLAIIAENEGVGSTADMCEITQDNLLAADSNAVFTEPAETTIDGRNWLTYDATATVQNINIKYRFYVYSDSEQSFQIVAWTGPRMFDQFVPIMQRVAVSFKFPK